MHTPIPNMQSGLRPACFIVYWSSGQAEPGPGRAGREVARKTALLTPDPGPGPDPSRPDPAGFAGGGPLLSRPGRVAVAGQWITFALYWGSRLGLDFYYILKTKLELT